MRDRRRWIGFSGRLSGAVEHVGVDSGGVNDEEHRERRVERAVFETDRHLIVGDVILPPSGYQSRFSDSINRGEFEFMQLTNVEITSLADGATSQRPFLALSKRHIRLSYPLAE
jgi:hypothetical protein